jgi:hypothetical protein
LQVWYAQMDCICVVVRFAAISFATGDGLQSELYTIAYKLTDTSGNSTLQSATCHGACEPGQLMLSDCEPAT